MPPFTCHHRAAGTPPLLLGALVLLLSCWGARGTGQAQSGHTARDRASGRKMVQQAQMVQYGPKTELPNSKIFQNPVAFCEGCYGFVSEVTSLLQKWSEEPGSMEEHIEVAFLATCKRQHLSIYALSPRKMLKLCFGILAHYEEEVGLALLALYSSTQDPSQRQAFDAVCGKAVPACRGGVTPLSMPKAEKRSNLWTLQRAEL